MAQARNRTPGLSRRRLLALLSALASLLPFSLRPARADSGLYRCGTKDCGHVYDPAVGDPDKAPPFPPGTPFEALPEDWLCPVCAAPKDSFRKYTPLKL